MKKIACMDNLKTTVILDKVEGATMNRDNECSSIIVFYNNGWEFTLNYDDRKDDCTDDYFRIVFSNI